MDPGGRGTERVSLKAAWQACTAAGVAPLLWLLVAAAFQAALPVFGLLAMQALVDSVALGVSGALATDEAWGAALQATGVAGAVAFAGAALRSVVSVLAENHGRRLADASVQRLQLHAASLPLMQFERPEFHDTLQRAGAEAAQRPVRLTQDFVATAVALLSLVAMSALLIRVEPWLPLVVAAAAVPIAWSRRRHARLRFMWQRANVVEQRAVGYIGGVLTGRASAKDVRSLGLKQLFGARIAALRGGLRASLAALARRRAREELLVHTVASAALFGAYVYLADAALAGLMTIGGLVLHAQAAQRTQGAVRDLLAAAAGVHEHRLFLRPVADFYALPAADDDDDATTLAELVRLTDVSFAYPNSSAQALEGVNLTLRAGERVAVIGANGSGKSTLLKLIAGLHQPTSGNADRARPLRTAVLWQDAVAFELTLRENLELGGPGPRADNELWRALKGVGMQERVAQLPAGLDTPWSKRLQGGVDWSAGEARRIVLARELLRPSDLLLLDEPFAFLDGQTARAVADSLRDDASQRAIVIVEHRGPALRCVDRVIWIKRGRVHADGSPAAIRAHPDFEADFPDWMQ